MQWSYDYPVISSGEFAHKGSFDSLLGEKEAEISRENLSLEKLVSIETPKRFLTWHTFDDGTVPVQNSLWFSNALASNKVQFELHIYPSGVHGLGLCEEIAAMNGRSEHINSSYSKLVWFGMSMD